MGLQMIMIITNIYWIDFNWTIIIIIIIIIFETDIK